MAFLIISPMRPDGDFIQISTTDTQVDYQLENGSYISFCWETFKVYQRSQEDISLFIKEGFDLLKVRAAAGSAVLSHYEGLVRANFSMSKKEARHAKNAGFQSEILQAISQVEIK